MSNTKFITRLYLLLMVLTVVLFACLTEAQQPPDQQQSGQQQQSDQQQQSGQQQQQPSSPQNLLLDSIQMVFVVGDNYTSVASACDFSSSQEKPTAEKIQQIQTEDPNFECEDAPPQECVYYTPDTIKTDCTAPRTLGSYTIVLFESLIDCKQRMRAPNYRNLFLQNMTSR
ncbi:hypothetical protein BDF20DRAFT_857715 [Mycotypha africana]|uniref:uncharacterized protein n=1 Tax=Mycotypha africana TaxID=64632 RepID=UPI0022FFF5C8|nr:uncharacterized protein BDF20DRAFT_857715 [Mycotypha africana]KAI8984054.1 hypothetical protein BDF20DRAFT_857715 [Mycotypha africana]